MLHEPALFPRCWTILTVQVSEMFRDPAYFRALREKVVPLLRTYPSLKIWVAGCSTGEEVYSLAILLREEGLLERTLIYATDINAAALETAAGGHLRPRPHRAASPRTTASPAATARCPTTTPRPTAARSSTSRCASTIVFADHSLATDSVFAEVQLVSCRNVLIYFDRALQDRAIGLFRDSLCRKGFLGLGAKESLRFSHSRRRLRRVRRGDDRIFQKESIVTPPGPVGRALRSGRDRRLGRRRRGAVHAPAGAAGGAAAPPCSS